MWLKHDDEMVNLDDTLNIIKYSSYCIVFFKEFPVYCDNGNPQNGVYFEFDDKPERDAYWDKHIIPLLNK